MFMFRVEPQNDFFLSDAKQCNAWIYCWSALITVHTQHTLHMQKKLHGHVCTVSVSSNLRGHKVFTQYVSSVNADSHLCLQLEGVLLYLLRTPLSSVQESLFSLPALSVSSVFASTVATHACPVCTSNCTKHLSKSNAASPLKELLLTPVHLQLAGMPASHKAS